MRSRSGPLLLGISTLIVGLIVFFPARVAYQWVAPPALKLGGLSGSVWVGSAREASIKDIYLRDLQWKVKPLAFFKGKLGYAINASPVSGFFNANVTVGFAGSVTLTEANGVFPLQVLEQSLQISGLRGRASLQLDRLQLRDGFPVDASGFVDISDLQVPAIHRASIGGYRAEFFTQEAGVAASVEDTDGSIDIAGSLQLSADHSYQFIALLAAKAEAPESIRRQLQFLGSANDRGQYTLRLEGRL